MHAREQLELENGINTGRCQRLLDLTTVIARDVHFFVELSLMPFNPKSRGLEETDMVKCDAKHREMWLHCEWVAS